MTLKTPPETLWADLQPGDGLLYRSRGVWARLIMIKTFSPVTHVEVYMGHGIAYAARDGIGVRSFPVRTSGLYAVVRPEEPFQPKAATDWFNRSAVGQRYDWSGLFRFFTVGKQSTTKQFCSELAVRLWRAGGVHLFHDDYDADLVSPGMILCSPHAVRVWTAV